MTSQTKYLKNSTKNDEQFFLWKKKVEDLLQLLRTKLEIDGTTRKTEFMIAPSTSKEVYKRYLSSKRLNDDWNIWVKRNYGDYTDAQDIYISIIFRNTVTRWQMERLNSIHEKYSEQPQQLNEE